MQTNTILAMSSQHLCMHIDVNRTIVMVDSAAGSTVNGQYAATVCDTAWGREVDGEWQPANMPLSDVPPPDKSMCTLLTFLRRHAAPSANPYREVYARLCTEGEGVLHPTLVPRVAELRAHVRMPEDVRERATAYLACEHITTAELGTMESAWSRGEYFLLPAFLNLVSYLEHDPSTSVVLRTFGSDGGQALREIRLIEQGRHPMFNGQLDHKRRIVNPTVSSFFRGGPDDGDVLLAIGLDAIPRISFDAAHPPLLLPQEYTAACERLALDPASVCSIRTKECIAALAEMEQTFKVVRGVKAAAHAIEELSKPYIVTLVHDYYPYWDLHNWEAHAGKIMPCSEATLRTMESPTSYAHTCTPPSGSVHIMVDDTIARDDARIATVANVAYVQQRPHTPMRQEVRTWEFPFRRTQNAVLFRTDTLRILDSSSYFINVLTNIRSRIESVGMYYIEARAPTQCATITVGTVPGYSGGEEVPESTFKTHLHKVLPYYRIMGVSYRSEYISTPSYEEKIYRVICTASPRHRDEYGLDEQEFTETVRKVATDLGTLLRQTRVYIDYGANVTEGLLLRMATASDLRPDDVATV